MPKNRAPGLMMFPEKFLAGTDHLSDGAFTPYTRFLMRCWAHSEDYCSMPNDEAFIRKRLHLTKSKYKKFWLEEVMDPQDPLLVIEEGRIFSRGLKKEFDKQKAKSERAKVGADARWRGDPDKVGMQTHPPSTPSDMPSSSSSDSSSKLTETSSSLGRKNITGKFDKAAECLDWIKEKCPELRHLTWDQWIGFTRMHSKTMVYSKKFLQYVVDKAVLDGDIRKPGVWLDTKAAYFEKDNRGDIRRENVKRNQQELAIDELISFVIEVERDPAGCIPGRTPEEMTEAAMETFRSTQTPGAWSEMERRLEKARAKLKEKPKS